ncbi:RagB/SusD family nutrient uptake outer membrane protein [Pedobacter sp. BS3]|uniref:RagB/SusD family nutrient uptake outer membrane protein n=1 Tax=Pedobacter sp. BS3 TaxID=2567937 RepID=UPI0011EC806B|nr:RagB/SusD family nutrient uptake outer membrane protein [Pedobacter sp. BS3]TZF82802.1 RagB/SusD family nutrient uptake outer membrane protein [Pedobacter sp. BS3]
MKKTVIAFALLALTAATSCNKDFIDLKPKDSYTDEVFYKTEEQFKSAVVAAYAPLRDVLVNDYFTSEMHSDNTGYQPIPSNRGTAYIERENISDFTNTSTNAYAAATWEHSYKGISRCNIIIGKLSAADIPEATKTNLDGQAKFLRALNYFKLVRLFGPLPLFTTEVTRADDAFIPRSSVDEVYAQIIADAKDAINELPAPAFPQTGVATKGAATMLLAEVYATQKKWTDAEQLLRNLLTMGYALNANYADVFNPANKNSKESIFEIQFLGGTVTGSTPNPLSFHFIPRSTDTKLLTGITVNNTSTGGWNTPTQNLINDFEPNDKRLDASIGIAEGTYNASDYFTYSAVKSIINYTPAPGKVGVPYIKKYLHSPLPNATGSSDDFPIYRYADALLLLAEALNEQPGKSSQALTYLNMVRDRAFGAGVSPITTTDPNALREIIYHERRVELAFENHRWEDLLRTGRAISVMNAFGITIDNHNLLFPVPDAEIGVNPKLLPQNPGYF